LKPNLTLNFGLRNDMVGDDHDLNGAYANASPANLWGPTTVGAFFQPGTLGGIANPTFNSHVHAYATQWVNLQPAAALAWSPKFGGFLGNILPDGKTVIRTGWSKRMYQEGAQNFWAYASNQGSFFFQSGSAVPDTTGALGTFQPGTVKLGQTLPQYALFPTTWAPTLPESTLSFNSSFWAMNPNIRQPYVEQWNFGIERQIGAGTALEVRYVGNEGQHAWFNTGSSPSSKTPRAIWPSARPPARATHSPTRAWPDRLRFPSLPRHSAPLPVRSTPNSPPN
jgi:hypothetical protein